MTEPAGPPHALVRLRPAARDTLLALDKPVRRRLQRAIDDLGRNHDPPAGVELAGCPGGYRFGVGDHQVVYAIDGKEVLILLIDQRQLF